MPRLGEPVPRPLRGDGATVELAGQPDGEVADVDHLLDLAERFGADLARFDRDEVGEIVLVLAQELTETAYQVAACGGRRRPPLFERTGRLADGQPGFVHR